MKHFFRTRFGKTLLFLGCVLFAAAVTLCILGFVLMYVSGLPFYTGTAEEFRQVLEDTVSNESLPPRETVLVRLACSAAYTLRYALFLLLPAAAILFLLCFILLLLVAARRPGTDEPVPSPLHKIPADLLLLAVGAAAFLLLVATAGFGDIPDLLNYSVSAVAAAFSVLFLCALLLGLGLCFSIAGRLRCRTLWKYSAVRYLVCFIWKCLCLAGRCCRFVFRGILRVFSVVPLFWKAFLILAVLILLDCISLFLILDFAVESGVFLFTLVKIVTVGAVLFFAYMLSRLREGGEALAAGDLSHKTDTARLIGDCRRHGENLNRIAEGMNLAVEERLRSERMKTELITNVSHDIRTPLTSVINYADLISREECGNPAIRGYCEVLLRQSSKLKRLIDDLVEASKASSGSLDVSMAPCRASVFVTQACGEYEDRLQSAGLTLVTKLPAKELMIQADGRRMWRIFDNLMNNICKYSQPGTRVYLTLTEEGENAVFTFKNTSGTELDISAEELMERFVRGDASRSTEGNGLGLSIARSMAELQNGTLSISVDGDLFKATLRFPEIR